MDSAPQTPLRDAAGDDHDSASPPEDRPPAATEQGVAQLRASLGLGVVSARDRMKHKAYIYSVYQIGVCIATTAHSQCNLMRRLVQDRKVRRVYTTLMPFDGARGFEAKETGGRRSRSSKIRLSSRLTRS